MGLTALLRRAFPSVLHQPALPQWPALPPPPPVPETKGKTLEEIEAMWGTGSGAAAAKAGPSVDA